MAGQDGWAGRPHGAVPCGYVARVLEDEVLQRVHVLGVVRVDALD